MATKMNLMKYLQEVRGFAQIEAHPFPNHTPALRIYPLAAERPQLRKHLPVIFKDPPALPLPVKINFVPGTSAAP
jgi:hypothetical protein